MRALALAATHRCTLTAPPLPPTHTQIKGLLLNAGVNMPQFSWSRDGVETTWATNHLGHFYLAQLLLPSMAPDGRVVVTSSGTHDPAVKAPLPEPKWDKIADVAMLK